MSHYTRGNLAIQRKQQPQEQVMETRRVVYRKKVMPIQEKLLYLFTILVCIIVAGIIISRYAQIYELNTKMQKVEKEIARLEAENENMKMEIWKQHDPKQLMDKANQLGGFTPADEKNTAHIYTNATP